jgi:uncharacterized sulfatase
MGADYVKTPHMDALAKSGTLFTQGYVPENHCRPSLQTLMTGTLPIDYNFQVDSMARDRMARMRFSSEEAQNEWHRSFKFNAMQYFNTLPRILSKKGYTSFQAGKWWEYNYQNGGFSEGMTTGWTKEDEKTEGWFKKFMGGDGTNLARVTMEPVYDYIERNNENPMFIWYAPELPHYPFNAPDKYYSIYENESMSESAKRYYANCSWFDDGVGELIRYLKEKDEFDDTFFIYVNDNGWEQNPDQEFRNDSLRWHNGGDKGKLSMYDQSFRTPIIFNWKDKIQSGNVKLDLIHSADIPATILDYTGIEIPSSYYGKSYKKVIDSENQIYRTEIIGNINQIRSEKDMMGENVEGYWIRTEDWFFNWNMTSGEYALFNMKKDEKNNNNLIAKHQLIAQECIQKIKAWKKERKGTL